MARMMSIEQVVKSQEENDEEENKDGDEEEKEEANEEEAENQENKSHNESQDEDPNALFQALDKKVNSEKTTSEGRASLFRIPKIDEFAQKVDQTFKKIYDREHKRLNFLVM